MTLMEAGVSNRALLSAAQLVRTYIDSVEGDVTGEVNAILDAFGDDPTALHGLVAAVAGVAGHAVMVITARLEAEAGGEDDLERRLERVAKLREEVLAECVQAVREFRPAAVHFPPPSSTSMRGLWERRSGSDRRIGSDRRVQPAGGSSEKINLRLFGERRAGTVDRRGGTDRRRSAVGV
jgi:hypothetical protein